MRFVLLFPLIFLFACNRSAMQKKLSDCDSLVITFNAPGSDSIVKTISTVESKAIRKLGGLVASKPESRFKCGYDGSLVFYRQGKPVLPVVFKFSDKDCRHFLYEVDGKVESTRLNNEAADLLQSLAQGSDTY